MLKAIHAQENRKAALKKVQDVQARLREMRYGNLADWIGETVAETLSYFPFPDKHWVRIRTNNPVDARDPTTNPGRGGLPRWPVLSGSGGCQAPAYHGNERVFNPLS